jgi:hypothetical protein
LADALKQLVSRGDEKWKWFLEIFFKGW